MCRRETVSVWEKVYILPVCVCVCPWSGGYCRWFPISGVIADLISHRRILSLFQKNQHVVEGGGGVWEEWIMSVMCERRLSPSPSFPVWEGTLCPYLFLYPHGSQAQSHCSLSFVCVWECVWIWFRAHLLYELGNITRFDLFLCWILMTDHSEHHDCDMIGCIFIINVDFI